MIFAFLTLLSALSLAVVSGWFSIIGIISIYAGAPMYALAMGAVAEVAKLVTTSWLYRNWDHTNWKLKALLIYFTLALMLATSIGVYGFLSKAHLEQGAGTINNSSKIERLNYQIDSEKSLIADNEKVIGQLDATVNSFLGKERADRSLSVRKSQAPQRKQLKDDILEEQKQIDQLSNEKFQLESEVRKFQLDVGPIRYIAELFYGATEDTSKNIESAVRIFTLLIVTTLDPLAIILLIAANHTLLRLKNERKKTNTQEDKEFEQQDSHITQENMGAVSSQTITTDNDREIISEKTLSEVIHGKEEAISTSECETQIPATGPHHCESIREVTRTEIDTILQKTISASSIMEESSDNKTISPTILQKNMEDKLNETEYTAMEENKIFYETSIQLHDLREEYEASTAWNTINETPEVFDPSRTKPSETLQKVRELDEEENTILAEGQTIKPIGLLAIAPKELPIILQPNLTQVIRRKVDSRDVETMVQNTEIKGKVQEISATENNHGGILSELFGTSLHFVPKKVNEERLQKNDHDETFLNKYPKALSWLTEFKRS